MSIKVLILFFYLVGFSQQRPAKEAHCTCGLLGSTNPIPEYCTSVVMEKTQAKEHNYFELVTDLTDKVHQILISGLLKQANPRTSLKGFKTIESIDECANVHYLEVNQTYLIGSDFQGEGDKRQPTWFPCRSWVEPWDYSLEKSNARLDEYIRECTTAEPNQPIPDNIHSLRNPGK